MFPRVYWLDGRTVSCSKVLHMLFIEIIEGCQCGVNKDSNRNLQARIKQLDKNKAIVGGQEADINSIPWQVGIMGNCIVNRA